MKSLVYILFFGQLIIGCQERKSGEPEKEELYFPEKADFADGSKLVFYKLTSFDNYQNLFQTIDSVSCANKEPVIQFQNSRYKFNMIAHLHCSEANYIADYKLKNVIGINNDSVIVNRDIRTPNKDLGEVMKKHYLNNGRSPDYADRPENAVINLYLDPATETKKIQDLLEKIATEFYEIEKGTDGNLRLMVLFKDYPMEIFPIPPMP